MPQRRAGLVSPANVAPPRLELHGEERGSRPGGRVAQRTERYLNEDTLVAYPHRQLATLYAKGEEIMPRPAAV